MNRRPLKIGYLMQADSVQMNKVSGPQLHVKAVVQGFERRGHQVRMVAIQKGRIQWSDDLVNWHPADFGYSESKPFRIVESILRGIQSRLHLPFLRLFDSYRFSDACVSALSACDILYERYGLLSYGGLIAAKRLGIPLVSELNGDLFEEYAQLGLELSRFQWAAIHFITRQMFKHTTHIVAVSEPLKQGIVPRLKLDPAKFSVVINGAEVDLFVNATQAESEDIRSRYGVRDEPLIIFVGSFQPWHSIDLLIEAFALMASTNTKPKLVLVGDGKLRSEMESKVHSLQIEKRVLFTGRVSHQDVVALLAASQVAVLPHRHSMAALSGTPLKLLEYMAAGKAIVAPALPNMKRILTDRVTALLVPSDNPEALADAMVELLEDEQLRSKMGQAAKQEAIEKHSWDRAVSELDAILYDLLDEQKARLVSQVN